MLSEDSNPYQPPTCPTTIPDQPGIWRCRSYLVVSIPPPTFPPRCVHTNAPCEGDPIKLNLTWAPFHALFTKKISLEVFVSRSWLKKRRTRILFGWGLLAISIFGLTGIPMHLVDRYSLFFYTSENYETYIFIWVITALLGVVVLRMFDVPILRVTKMTKHHVWLGDVDPDFLASLPEWPH